jgi:iron(III) transport system ATP-binding protein
MDALLLRGVTWRPRGTGAAVVDAVDLAVAPAEVVAVIGPSGAGKTSLLRLIAGLQAPDRGRIEIAGVDVTALGPAQRPVGLMAQEARLFPELTVLDNVAFRLRLQAGARAARQRALETLGLLGVEALAGRRPGELSEGEQQRVALARALAAGPSVLLLDEPMSHVDPRLRRALRREILTLQARLGLTLVYVTHDQHEAMALGDRIVLLHQGRIVQQGTPRNLYEQPTTGFVAAFMGEMRMFDGWCDDVGTVTLGPLRLPPCPLPTPGPGPVRVVVRPQAWRIGPAHGPGLAARVLRSACTGPRVEYELGTPLGELLVLAQRTLRRHENGAPVSLTLAGRGFAVLAPGLAGNPASAPAQAAASAPSDTLRC